MILGFPLLPVRIPACMMGQLFLAICRNTLMKNGVEIVGNYSGMTDINVERIAELEPDLILMNM